MLIENKGISTATFYIPPFDLKEGEIVVVNLFNGQHFYETATLLKNIFSGRIQNDNVVVHKDLAFVDHFIEPAFRRVFHPVTIKEYLKMNADLDSPFATKIYETKWINEKIKVNTLAGNFRSLLALYATLSKTNTIVFDLVGQDPIGAELCYGVVKEAVKNGGAAILLDGFDDMKNDCTKYVELKWIR